MIYFLCRIYLIIDLRNIFLGRELSFLTHVIEGQIDRNCCFAVVNHFKAVSAMSSL